MNEKQVAPPFKQVSNLKDETLATQSSATVPSGPMNEDNPMSVEQSETKEILQTPNRAIENVREYWSSGTIGGMVLGNKSGAVNPFREPKANERNPFQRTDEVKKVEVEQTLWEVPEGTPAWREMVQFVATWGKDIQAVRYPNPPRSVGSAIEKLGASTVIETMWAGVPVYNAERCQIQHKKYGWTSWEDCQS